MESDIIQKLEELLKLPEKRRQELWLDAEDGAIWLEGYDEACNKIFAYLRGEMKSPER